MASALTHAVVAASLLPAAPPALNRRALAVALVAASVLPDVDVIGLRLGVPYGDPLGHRGFTHSLFFAALAGAALAAWCPRVLADARDARARISLGLMVAIAMASHGALDALTAGGLGVGFLLPFDDTRYLSPWRPLDAPPLSIARFFGARGIAILADEVRWIWPPAAALALGLALARRRAR